MDQEDRVYAYQTLGKTTGQIFGNLTGFKATIKYTGEEDK
jgi:hypothetical protein